MSSQDIIWQQRFTQFEKAFSLLDDVIKIENPTVIERAAMLHFFELTFELSWQLLQEYHPPNESTFKSPKQVVLSAIKSKIIGEEDGWLEALADINEIEHMDDFDSAIILEERIKSKYFPALMQLKKDFRSKCQR